MNVHPAFSLLPPGPTTPEPFAADAIYEFKIDTNGDAVADIAYRVCFSVFANGKQTAVLRRVEGAQAAETGNEDRLVEEWPVSMDREAIVVEAEDHRFFAGWRSDPFFLIQSVPSTTSTSAAKTTLSTRTCAASSSSCRARLLEPNRSVSGRGRLIAPTGPGFKPTAVPSRRRRFSCPATPETTIWRRSLPGTVASFRFLHIRWSTREATLRSMRCVWQQRCFPTSCISIPTLPASYPDNGRALTDDVLDHFLSLLTNGKVKSDGVGPHRDLLAEFPYLGPPHMAAAERFNAHEALHGGSDARKD